MEGGRHRNKTNSQSAVSGPRAELTVRSNELGAMGSAHGGGRRQVVETGPWRLGAPFLSFLPLACQGSTGF